VIEIIAIGVFPVVVIVLTGLFIREKLFTKNLANELLQVMLDNKTILDNIEDKPSENNIEQTEGFVKFLSESREWAFEYIETVQSGLSKFVEQAGPRLEYFDKYGRVTKSPHIEGLEDILSAYRELQKLLPEENNKEK
jgi:uncharacterized protein YneF (UPF0154 family)